MVGEAHADGTITNSSGAGTVTQLPLGRASASVTDAGLVSWSYQLKDGVSFSYVKVQWIEKPASGSPNWNNASEHQINAAGTSSYRITGLTSGTEYVARVVIGLSESGVAKQVVADAGTFTPSRLKHGLASTQRPPPGVKTGRRLLFVHYPTDSDVHPAARGRREGNVMGYNPASIPSRQAGSP